MGAGRVATPPPERAWLARTPQGLRSTLPTRMLSFIVAPRPATAQQPAAFVLGSHLVGKDVFCSVR
jgi:hypothetical protein